MSVELDLAGRIVAALLFGAILGGVGVYVVQRRIEKTLRFALDRRDADYIALSQIYTNLVKEMIALRREGFGGHGKGTVRDAPDPEAVALARAEQVGRQRIEDAEFIERAADDLQAKRPELSRAAARREGAKLLAETRMEQPPS